MPIRPVFPALWITWGAWFAMVFGVVGLIRVSWGAWRRHRWRARGWCVHCGYNLGGVVDPCPECGHASA
ncbi:MAG: hypothetical protein DHS20C14_17160 [Phycisphaeraceae bacterium]|nr:MAG: hypothetical protein DHS20C14_17160 [Phycisphaeraceae bacterium]